MRKIKVVMLLAGMGSRLSRPYPKALTKLDYGESILQRQSRIFRSLGLPMLAVVGFKKDLIMEALPDALFAYNPDYDTTNTSKSLLAALRNLDDDTDVLWVNGDVVFDEGVLELLLASPTSAVAVNNARVAEEEIKYTLNPRGFIQSISKTVQGALGEALGINLVKAEHLPAFREKLGQVDDNDYFERAMELLIEDRGDVFRAVDVGQLRCVEVDFATDLDAANTLFR